MSKVERRHERAIVVLKAIARMMGNAVFRVEDYRPPHERRAHTGNGKAGDEHHGEAENPPAAKRAGRDGP
jgi:hypothetical protein